LEVSIGLCLVWTNEGKNLDELTAKFNEKNFSSKLNFIEDLAHKKYPVGSSELNKYISWIKDTNDVRDIRNQLFHGRYGFIPQQGCVANVTGIPTSSEQVVTKYTIKQLKQLKHIVKRIDKLAVKINVLRKECPI